MRPRSRLAILGLLFAAFVTEAAPAAAQSTVAVAELPAIFLHVNNLATGLPVAGADVVVSFVGGDPDHPFMTGKLWKDETNGGGFALFKGLEPGVEVISISAEGYVSFGDATEGRLPTGMTVIYAGYRQGAGAAGNPGIHVSIALVPLAPCRVCPPG